MVKRIHTTARSTVWWFKYMPSIELESKIGFDWDYLPQLFGNFNQSFNKKKDIRNARLSIKTFRFEHSMTVKKMELWGGPSCLDNVHKTSEIALGNQVKWRKRTSQFSCQCFTHFSNNCITNLFILIRLFYISFE